MFTLTQQEVDTLLKSPDAAVVAATKKLIAVEESGEFVPKSRLNKETEEAKQAREKLDAFEKAQVKAEEDRKKKAGEFEKLFEDEKQAHIKTQAERDDEKKIADEYRKLRKEALKSYKEQLGDRWDDSYESLPLEALAKLAGTKLPIIGSVSIAPGLPEKTSLQKQYEDALKKGDRMQIISLKRQIYEQQQKDKGN